MYRNTRDVIVLDVIVVLPFAKAFRIQRVRRKDVLVYTSIALVLGAKFPGHTLDA